MTQDDLVERIQKHSWFHSIDLGDGLVTNGVSPPEVIMDLPGSIPDLTGKSVLDIGAWDGKYSFLAEARGASRVVALDHYVWQLDWAARQAYYAECEAAGVLPEQDRIDTGFLIDGETPGKAGFDLARTYLDSQVEAEIGDYMTMDLDRLGSFDVVFYFGVLYHMVNPIASLQRLRRLTKGVAVIETAGIAVPGYPVAPLLELYAGDELAGDYSNWFAPTEQALHALCRAAGFSRVETKAVTPLPIDQAPPMWADDNRPAYCRLLVQAFVDPDESGGIGAGRPRLQTEAVLRELAEAQRTHIEAQLRESRQRVAELRSRLRRKRAQVQRLEGRVARLRARNAKRESVMPEPPPGTLVRIRRRIARAVQRAS